MIWLLLAKLLPNTSGEAIYFTDIAFFSYKNKNGEVIGVYVLILHGNGQEILLEI